MDELKNVYKNSPPGLGTSLQYIDKPEIHFNLTKELLSLRNP